MKDLEQPTISGKVNGIKQAILLLLSGENMSRYARVGTARERFCVERIQPFHRRQCVVQGMATTSRRSFA